MVGTGKIKKEVERLEILKLEKKETITSLELLEQINVFRKQEGKRELGHNDLKKVIRKELEKDFNAGKISHIKQKDSRGRKQDIYILSFSQGKRVLLRESPTVRQAVIEYIEALERELKKEIEKNRRQSRLLGKTIRALETDTLKKLIEIYNVPKEKQNYIYSNYTRLAYRVMGYKEKPDREEMGENELNLLQQIEAVINLELINNMSNKKPLKEIYINCKNKALGLYREIEKLYIQEDKRLIEYL